MQWWIVTPNNAMAVDNQLCMGMDLSSIPSDIFMVQWREGKGEIERGDGTNGTPSPLYEGIGNGLREIFIDVTPYAPLFQQFLTRVPNLTLPQAKKIQIDLIGVIFDSKRQAPFHYTVAAGDYYWDASDANMFSSLVPTVQNIIAKANETSTKLNSAFPAVNSNIVEAGNTLADVANETVAAGDDDIVAGVNANVVAPSSTLVSAINSGASDPGAALTAAVNADIVTPLNNIISELNTMLLTDEGRVTQMNTELTAAQIAGGSGGLRTALAYLGSIVTAPTYVSAAFAEVGNYLSNIARRTTPSIGHYFTDIPWTPIAALTGSNTAWIPVGGTVPVNVTAAEQAAIMQGVAARTNDLLVKKNTKIGEVNALTTIPAVIAYDVTTGW